jgi:hypothetical protein
MPSKSEAGISVIVSANRRPVILIPVPGSGKPKKRASALIYGSLF